MIFKLFKERDRTRAIDRLGLLTRPADPGFEQIVEDAASAFAAPMALLNLIHTDQQITKASHGIAVDRIPRCDCICTNLLDTGTILEICDTRADARVSHLPAVTQEPAIRYYIGAPLTLIDGTDIGALCVLDSAPRPAASADQRAYLLSLGRRAAAALEGHRRLGTEIGA